MGNKYKTDKQKIWEIENLKHKYNINCRGKQSIRMLLYKRELWIKIYLSVAPCKIIILRVLMKYFR